MAREDLDELGADLYQEVLLDHYKAPRNPGTIDGADIDHDGDNPTCGDMVHVYATIGAKNEIRDIRFTGKGCAISQASERKIVTVQPWVETRDGKRFLHIPEGAGYRNLFREMPPGAGVPQTGR